MIEWGGRAGGAREGADHVHRAQGRRADRAGPDRARDVLPKTGKTLYYAGRSYQSLKGQGFKSNYFDVETGENYWMSGCRRDGQDRLYGERDPVHIDEDVRATYWTEIRGMPEQVDRRTT